MRKLKRTKDFEISLELCNETFIRPPRDSQRHWVLNRILAETVDSLVALNELVPSFVAGSDELLSMDREHVEMDDGEIMEDWQIPLMEEMAKEVAIRGKSILEVGFGRGVASDLIQSQEVSAHTIIDCNPSVLERCRVWRTKFPSQSIDIVEGRWEDEIGNLGLFDGIFFHTYPLSESEFVERVAQSSTFAEHFFSVASEHLNPGGVFTYMTNEIDSLGRGHQRALFKHFSGIKTRLQRGLNPPEDTRDALWGNQMVIVAAQK